MSDQTWHQSQGMLNWLKNYQRAFLIGDISAGVIVALLLIPQGVAYAIVAGLPPVTGLYASILPPLAYALFGSSMVQSVGAQAITALMIGTTLATMAPPGSPLNLVLAAQMALIAGVTLLVCGALRLGFLASFLSRPVMSGFTSGSALVIAGEQLRPLLGGALTSVRPYSAGIGLGSLLLMWLAKKYLARLLEQIGIRKKWADTLSRLAPVAVLLTAMVLVSAFGLNQLGVAVVGKVPSGLPDIGFSVSNDHWRALLGPSMLMAFVIFLFSQSAAQSLAQKRNERIKVDHELFGLGAANLLSAVSGGFPVTGSISRSAVNYEAGANTPLASVISAAILALVLVAPTGWLSWLPMPVLAATIIIAVAGMIDFATLKESWNYDRSDAAAMLGAAGGVILLGIEAGVMLGVALSLAGIIWRASHPHIAVLGRIAGSEHFRNIHRHEAETLVEVLMLRIDSDLFFGNADIVVGHVENLLNERTTQGLHTHHVLLVMSAVNVIDTTALHALIELNKNLRDRDITLHFSEIKGPVMDRLQRSHFMNALPDVQLFLSTAQAYHYFEMHPPLSR